MKPEEIEALAERIARHNRWRRGDVLSDREHEYTATQYGLDLDTAVQLLRDLARELRGDEA